MLGTWSFSGCWMLELGAFAAGSWKGITAAPITATHEMTKLPHRNERRHPLWQLSVMRWRIFIREPAAVFWTYGFPVVLALALGIAFRNRPPEPVEVAVEASPGSEVWRDALATNSSVHVRWLKPQEAREA